MKASKGYLLLETAAACCLGLVLLLTVLIGFKSCVQMMTAQRQMVAALEICQLYEAGQPVDLPAGWRIEDKLINDSLTAREIKVVQGEKTICNWVRFAK